MGRRKKKKKTKYELRIERHEQYQADHTRLYMKMADLTKDWVLHRVCYEAVTKGHYRTYNPKKSLRDFLRSACQLERLPKGVPSRAWDICNDIWHRRDTRKKQRHGMVQEPGKSTGAFRLAPRPFDKNRTNATTRTLRDRVSARGFEAKIADKVLRAKGVASVGTLHQCPSVHVRQEFYGYLPVYEVYLRVREDYIKSVVVNRLGSIEGCIVLDAQCIFHGIGVKVYNVAYIDWDGEHPESIGLRHGAVRIEENKKPELLHNDRDLAMLATTA